MASLLWSIWSSRYAPQSVCSSLVPEPTTSVGPPGPDCRGLPSASGERLIPGPYWSLGSHIVTYRSNHPQKERHKVPNAMYRQMLYIYIYTHVHMRGRPYNESLYYSVAILLPLIFRNSHQAAAGDNDNPGKERAFPRRGRRTAPTAPCCLPLSWATKQNKKSNQVPSM